MMREKPCEICKEVFSYKNKTKKYCSNACKQQALRNRETVLAKQVVSLNQSIPTVDNNELINQIFNKCIKQTEGMCNGMSIHHSILTFMKDMINTLRLGTKSDNKLKNQLERMQGLFNKLDQIAQEDKCEYGYITFEDSAVRMALNKLDNIKRLRKK
ncbi:MAG: hypothetical protein GQ574_22455 [Crocinitomix sp.]|nr:hypothetical protein [Crocinitomix sp.]